MNTNKLLRISLQKIALDIELLEDCTENVANLPADIVSRIVGISNIVQTGTDYRDCDRCGQTWKHCEC